MKAKELLNAAFVLRKGKAYMDIVWNVEEGEINPNATYIQTFDKYTTFSNGCVRPDVTFKTTAGATSYLYKVD